VAPATERLRYGRESIEDDPFIVAASTQSLNSIDRKKEKTAPSINYGYFSEGMYSFFRSIYRLQSFNVCRTVRKLLEKISRFKLYTCAN